MRNTYCEISHATLTNNLNALRALCKPTTKVCAVVKANAYGHGLVSVAKTLAVEGADYFAVAIVKEGIQLRNAGITTPILVLAGIEQCEIDDCIKHDLTITASSLEKLQYIIEQGIVMNQPPRIHLKIDTGMNRLGVHWNRSKEFIDTAKKMADRGVIICEGMYSHFADAGNKEFTKLQFDRFTEVMEYAKSINLDVELFHFCNSHAMLEYPEYHLDMVRPGIALYGVEPEPDTKLLPRSMHAVLSWKSRVVYFKVVTKDETVGYGQTWSPTDEYSRIVTIPVGYADGFPRRLSNVGNVIIHGLIYPIVGRVCMDQTMVDLGMKGESYLGDTVTLIGREIDQVITVEQIATLLNTTTHEITTCISDRVPRIDIE